MTNRKKPWYKTKRFIAAVATVFAMGITSVTGLPPAVTGVIADGIANGACAAVECVEE